MLGGGHGQLAVWQKIHGVGTANRCGEAKVSLMFTLSERLSPSSSRLDRLAHEIQDRSSTGPEDPTRFVVERVTPSHRRARRLAEIPDHLREPLEVALCRFPASLVMEARNAMADYQDFEGFGLVAPEGAGKSRLLAHLLQALPEEVSWRYLPAARLAAAVSDQGDDEARVARKAARLLQEIRWVEVLALDDLGEGEWPATVGEELLHVLNHRLAHGLTTLWAGRVHPRHMRSAYGAWTPAISDRLFRGGRVVVVSGAGEVSSGR